MKFEHRLRFSLERIQNKMADLVRVSHMGLYNEVCLGKRANFGLGFDLSILINKPHILTMAIGTGENTVPMIEHTFFAIFDQFNVISGPKPLNS